MHLKGQPAKGLTIFFPLMPPQSIHVFVSIPLIIDSIILFSLSMIQ